MRRRTLIVLGLLAVTCLPLAAHEKHGQKPKESKQGMEGMPGMEGQQQPTLEDQNVAPPRPAQSELKVLVSHFKQPEYLHVIVNVIPLLGMGFGAALLLAGLWLDSEGMREAGLALVAFAGAATLPTILLGQSAYDRIYERIPMEAQQWLDVHMTRAERLQWLFYLTGALAAWAFLSSRKKKPSALRQAQATLAAAGLCAALAGWISHAGGQVRHPEFRLGPPLRNAQPMQDHERPTEP